MSDQILPDSGRREFLKAGGALLLAGAALADDACAPLFLPGKPFSGTPDSYDVVIIGTGFGATVAATELTAAFPALRILMLERGVFFTSQERPVPPYLQDATNPQPYQSWPAPDNDAGFRDSFLTSVRLDPSSPYRANTGKSPLYHYSTFDDVDILTASGVGGGSLIYSNVSLEPAFDPGTQSHPVMADWPIQVDQAAYVKARDWMKKWRSASNQVVTTVPLSDDLKGHIEDLNAVPGPGGSLIDYSYLYLPRSRALKAATTNLSVPAGQRDPVVMKEGWKPLDLQVFDHGGTDAKELKGQRFCERQGRCALGCLPGARHTLNKTLINRLLTAPNSHVHLKPLSNVLQIRAVNAEYEVSYQHVVSGDEFRSRAKIVIVAAGVLGSTELLLRSRDLPVNGQGPLALSDALGSGFSTNGDFSGFVRGIPRDVKDAAGKPVDNRVFPTRGPINTSHVTFQAGQLYINVEDAGIPPMFAATARRIINAMQGGQLSFGKLISQTLDPEITRLTEHEMVQDMFWFNCMGTDGVPGKPFRDVGGRFELKHSGGLDLKYPSGSPVNHPVFHQAEEILRAYATSMKGSYVPFPLWGGLFGKKKLVVTHPLGGCPMGHSSTDGVVDTTGQVFDTKAGGTSVHSGLYVMDGSIFPGPVAVNPTLTIVAMSLKIMESVKSMAQTIAGTAASR